MAHEHSPIPGGVDQDDATTLARLFALLADPSRLRILYALLEGGSMCVSDIAAAARLGESATSHQLARLRSGTVVTSRRRGREIWYEVADVHVRLVLDLAAQHYLAEPA